MFRLLVGRGLVFSLLVRLLFAPGVCPHVAASGVEALSLVQGWGTKDSHLRLRELRPQFPRCRSPAYVSKHILADEIARAFALPNKRK